MSKMKSKEIEPKSREKWVMAMPFRVDYYRQFAWALEESGRLRMTYLWKKAGYPEVPESKTRLRPSLGALAYLSARYTNTRFAEKLRFRLYPFYDQWMANQLQPGDHVYSSYGYANESFRKVRKMGGKTFLDGGNSHPQNFWDVLSEEYERWGVREDPISRFHFERSLETVSETDYVISPSSFVSKSFLDRGFPEERVFKSFYPVDLRLFKPSDSERPANRPFTIVNTSGLSLRKGTPYLFEAFRKIHKQIPNARFLVTNSGNPAPGIERIIKEYSDLPIEWCGYLSHAKMAERFRQADLLMLPSLEDGFARVVSEALSCGLPVMVSENTGAADLVEEDINGAVAPIRDVESMVSAALAWWDRIRAGYRIPVSTLQHQLTQESYRQRVCEITDAVDLAIPIAR